jgi:hypothetical protein
MGLRSVQYNDGTQILTVTFDTGTTATFDYAAYLAANTPTRNAMIAAARGIVRDNGGIADSGVSLSIVSGRPHLICNYVV